MPKKTSSTVPPVERYRQTKKRQPSRDEDAGPSKRQPEAAPESEPTSRSDPYYDYHSDSDPLLSPADLKADRKKLDSASTEQQRQTAVTLVRQMALICHRSPEVELAPMLQQILCTLGPHFPGMPKDLRTVFQGPRDIEPTNVVNGSGQVVGSFWHRGLEAGIRAQSPLTIGKEDVQYYLHVGKVPLPQLADPNFQTWVLQAQLIEATQPPGEPFVVSVFCGSGKPNAPVLLGPLCNEAIQLRQRARESLTADMKTRAVLADAEARALVKDTFSQTAHHGCTKCTIEGVRIGKAISFHDNTASQPRTHASFVGHVYDDTHRKRMRRATPLDQLDIDVIADVCVADDRHLLHLGAAKRFYSTFTLGEHGATKMPENYLRYLHDRLCHIRFPHERKHKHLTPEIDMWPHSMWAYFLDVFGCVVLKPVLHPVDYSLYCLLHVAVAICNHKRYRNLLGYADTLFQDFVARYSERVGFVPCDIHNLLHVVAEVRDFESLPQISTNPAKSALSTVSPNVDTAHGPRAMQQVGTALMLRECARRSPGSCNSVNAIPTNNGRRVPIRPKFLLRSESISATDADSWFLAATGQVVKFESASVDNLGLLVVGRPLHQQKETFVHKQSGVPAELNVFATDSKTTFSEDLGEYRAADMVCKLCVVNMRYYTSFVPLFESFAEC